MHLTAAKLAAVSPADPHSEALHCFREPPAEIDFFRPPGAAGVFARINLADRLSEWEVDLGNVVGTRRFAACYRDNVCWMTPRIGARAEEVPRETQFLLLEQQGEDRGAERCLTLLVPLVDGGVRCSLRGEQGDRLILCGDSGDPGSTVDHAVGLYILRGHDPYRMMERAARDIAAQSRGAVRLRVDKPVPEFVRYIGWCSYNAFYSQVSHAKLVELLESYRRRGITPGFVILDDGWQCVAGSNRLAGFDADPAKFPGGIAALSHDLKDGIGVKLLMLWHAFGGFWRGVDPHAFSKFDARPAPVHLPKWFKAIASTGLGEGQATVGGPFYPLHVVDQPVVLPSRGLGALYSAFHAELRRQGADGVKIDAMAWVEMHGGGGRGGRVAAMEDLVRAAEASSAAHLNGNLLNCSSCSNDFVLQARAANVTRASADYEPGKPESHGRHLFINGHASFWMGQFVLPDWDMFQSGHAAGPFHAAARAISGGPIYTTDSSGQEDAELIRRLRFSDSRVPLCVQPAQPCADSFFVDPTRDHALFKVFNLNRVGGVVGLFNCRPPHEDAPIGGHYGARDVDGLQGATFAAYECASGRLRHLDRDDRLPLALSPLGWELVTFVAIRSGFAPIGMTRLLNCAGAVAQWTSDDLGHRVKLDDGGGEFLAYCAAAPRMVTVDGRRAKWSYDATERSLRVEVADVGPCELHVLS